MSSQEKPAHRVHSHPPPVRQTKMSGGDLNTHLTAQGETPSPPPLRGLQHGMTAGGTSGAFG